MTPIIRKTILELIEKVGANKSICPSEVARILSPHDWRALMEEVRQVASELHEEGKIEICQKGHRVSDFSFKGPIRLRLKL